MALLALGHASPSVAATKLLVANNSTDSATCGPASPCRTISQAITNASAGDKIIVGPGWYGDLNGDGIFNPADDDEVSGDATKMIISGGIELCTVGGSFEMNNIYGNDPTNNCGIALNVGDGPVAAQDNYWGAASGLGANPADQACLGTGAIDTGSFATAPFKIMAVSAALQKAA